MARKQSLHFFVGRSEGGSGGRESLHDISQPVHFGVFDGVNVKEIVLHECDPAFC